MKPHYRIVIVDDSDAIRSSLREFLNHIERATFDVAEACDGVHALKVLAGLEKVDLIITDLSMPRMDGLELIRHLRADPVWASVPILLLTATDEQQVKIDVFRSGATDYVVKPFLAPELEARILGYLERKRAFETIQQSVDQARHTQESLLPRDTPSIEGVSVSVKYVPAEHLSGDLFDFCLLDGGRVGVLVADVAGHGISAALVTFLIAGIFRNTAPEEPMPDALLRRLGEMVHGKLPQERYATATYAVLDPRALTINYSSAGGPPGILMRRRDASISEILLEGSPLGLGEPADARIDSKLVQLEPGDRVLLQSDGLLGVTNDRDQPLGPQRIRRFLAERFDTPAEELLAELFDHGLSFGGLEEYADDVTLIMLDIAR